MSYIYHILDKVPAIHHNEMKSEYEALARALIKSGRLRIDTDYELNFVRFSDPSKKMNLMFSKEELTDSELVILTKNTLKKIYSREQDAEKLEKKVSGIVSDLKKQAAKLFLPSSAVVEKLARLFVQSAHPIVINWLLHDRVEVFITYSHNIGDMMDMESWQNYGNNSGMQSTDGRNSAIFVSCGGNPFAENSKEHPILGSGWASVARLQIIAGQELGHFADIKRDGRGRQVTRHSANFSATLATPHVSKARKDDLLLCDKLRKDLLTRGRMQELAEAERKLQFYDKQKVWGLRSLIQKVKCFFYRKSLVSYAEKEGLYFVKRFKRDRYMALMIIAMLEDMKVNLAPMADVYRRADQEAQEAILCVEALARVPQQALKWGHLTTMETMKGLYKIYYKEVIPSLELSYSEMTGKLYKRNYNSYNRKGLLATIKSIFSGQQEQLVPVRDV